MRHLSPILSQHNTDNIKLRNIKQPVRQYKMESSFSKNQEFPPGINSLSFEPTIPSKFMVGTEQGGVIITRMQAKAGTNDWVLGEFENCHQGKVMVVDRNIFNKLIYNQFKILFSLSSIFVCINC